MLPLIQFNCLHLLHKPFSSAADSQGLSQLPLLGSDGFSWYGPVSWKISVKLAHAQKKKKGDKTNTLSTLKGEGSARVFVSSGRVHVRKHVSIFLRYFSNSS